MSRVHSCHTCAKRKLGQLSGLVPLEVGGKSIKVKGGNDESNHPLDQLPMLEYTQQQSIHFEVRLFPLFSNRQAGNSHPSRHLGDSSRRNRSFGVAQYLHRPRIFPNIFPYRRPSRYLRSKNRRLQGHVREGRRCTSRCVIVIAIFVVAV